jgi:hypothetical protein
MDSDLRDLPRSHPAGAPPATSPAGRGRAAAAALISVCLGFFVIQPDVTIVNVALGLSVPLLLATVGYLVAIALAWTTLRDR